VRDLVAAEQVCGPVDLRLLELEHQGPKLRHLPLELIHHHLVWGGGEGLVGCLYVNWLYTRHAEMFEDDTTRVHSKCVMMWTCAIWRRWLG
jgi:hypothetical protein